MRTIKVGLLIFILLLSSCSSSSNNTNRLAGYIERGDMYYEAGDFDNLLRAEDQYRRAINIDPNNVYVLLRLGDVYYVYFEYYLNLKDSEKSRQCWNISYNCYTEIMKNQPDNPVPYFGLAKLNGRLMRYDEGIKLMQRVLNLSSADVIFQAEAHRELGRLYNAQDKYADALKEFKEYLLILPDAKDADNIKRAIKELEKAINTPPEKK